MMVKILKGNRLVSLIEAAPFRFFRNGVVKYGQLLLRKTTKRRKRSKVS